jgi:hypothetical protein
MPQSALALPVRLKPRIGGQIGLLLFFLVFFGFACFWMAGAAGILDLDNGEIHDPRDMPFDAFPLVGLPFALIGLGGMAAALLRMLPSGRFYHLQITHDGLTIRKIFKTVRHAWSALPAFETIRVERKTKNGRRITYFTVANEGAAPPAGAPRGSRAQREVLRILADEFGARSEQEDADLMTGWFNGLRELARDGRLKPDARIDVPEPFRASAMSVQMPGKVLVGSSAPVIQQSSKSVERRPTVERR